MKNLTLALAVFAGMALSSCKKEVVTEQTTTVNADGTTTTTTKTTTDYDLMRLRKAEDDYRKAENDVIVARKKGDTKAEKVAQETADKAKEAWEATKNELKKAGANIKDATHDARQDIKESFKKKDTIVIK